MSAFFGRFFAPAKSVNNACHGFLLTKADRNTPLTTGTEFTLCVYDVVGTIWVALVCRIDSIARFHDYHYCMTTQNSWYRVAHDSVSLLRKYYLLGNIPPLVDFREDAQWNPPKTIVNLFCVFDFYFRAAVDVTAAMISRWHPLNAEPLNPYFTLPR